MALRPDPHRARGAGGPLRHERQCGRGLSRRGARSLEYPEKGYKAPASRGIREAILAALVETASGLEIGSEARASCIDVDHALDALVSALVARAVARGLTTGPDETRSAAAAHEGWIHLPRPDSLAHLVG
jgi:hypothetical protein